jgi:NADH dehydrogenase/NADH:ubiquinone oxidoreductase subunit G
MKALLDLFVARRRQPRLPPGRRMAGRSAARELAVQSTGIAGIEEADALLIIGANPRLEAPC